MKADARTEAAVLEVLEKLNEMYARRNVEGVVSLFVPDPQTVVIGTGADEKRVGLDEMKAGVQRDFAQSQSASLEFKNVAVSAIGPVAWASSELNARAKIGGQDVFIAGRFTGVLVNRGGRWLIAQMHWSVPSGEQSSGQSFPGALK